MDHKHSHDDRNSSCHQVLHVFLHKHTDIQGGVAPFLFHCLGFALSAHFGEGLAVWDAASSHWQLRNPTQKMLTDIPPCLLNFCTMLCDSFFNSCFAFRASLDLPLRSMDSNFHPLFDRS